MCQGKAKGRVCASRICVNYCAFEQDEQQDDGEDDEEDSQFKEIKYQDGDCNGKRGRVLQCFNGLSNERRVPSLRKKEMQLNLTSCLTLTLTVIYLLECSHKSVTCDNNLEETNNLTKQFDLLEVHHASKLGLSQMGPRLKIKLAGRQQVERSRRGVREYWPFYTAKKNENVELACHMFGAPLKLTKNRKWFVVRSKSLLDSNNLDDANNAQSLPLSSKTGDGNDKGWHQVSSFSHDKTTTLMPLGKSLEESSAKVEEGMEEAEDNDSGTSEDDYDERAGGDELSGPGDGVSDLTSQSSVALNELDLVSIIFWFKDDNPTPIYTLDARRLQANSFISKQTNSEQELDKKIRYATAANNIVTDQHHHSKKDNRNSNNNNSEIAKIMHTNMQLLSEARHYQSSRRGDTANPNQSSLKLDPISSFPVIKLIIEKAGPRDSGDYKCRVDFRRSSTVSQIVRLLVEVPISKVEISIAQGSLERGSNVVRNYALDRKPISLLETNLIQRGRPLLEPSRSSSFSSSHTTSPPAVLLDESESGEFICSVGEASPAPILTWYVSWPSIIETQSGHKKEESSDIVWTEPMLASSELGMSVETAPKSELIKQNLTALSKLNIARLERHFHRARFKCLAIQRASFTSQTAKMEATNNSNGNNKPKTAFASQSLPSASSINYRQSSSPSIRETSAKKKNEDDSQNANSSSNVVLVSSDNDNILRSRQSDSSGKRKEWDKKKGERKQQKLAMIDDFSEDFEGKNNELSKWFELHLNLKPKHIEIVSDLIRAKEPILSADQRLIYLAEVNEFESVKFVCSSAGSNPAAQIEWSLRESNGQLRNLSGLHKTSSSRMDMTNSSSLLELPSIDRHYHLAELTCKATNENLSAAKNGLDTSLSARVKLSVKFKPVVRLVDAYNSEGNREEWKQKRRLKCLVQSNPPINQLVWLVNEKPLAKIMAPTTNSRIHFLDGAPETTNKASAQKRPQSGSSGQLFQFSTHLPLNPMAKPMAGGDNSMLLLDDDTISEKEKATYIVPNNEWRFVPQQASAIDGSKYKFQANSLTVMNLTANLVTSTMTTTTTTSERGGGGEAAVASTLTTDRDQFFKCLAINALGQTTSTSSFRLSHNYAPTCVKQQQQQQQGDEEGDTINGKLSSNHEGARAEANVFHLDLDSTSQVNDLWARFSCNVQSNPPPTNFVWSFVPLEKVAKLIAEEQSLSINNIHANSHEEERRIKLKRKLRDFASSQTATKSNAINYIDLLNNGSNLENMRPLGGILICYAQNQVGRQLEPCLNLLLPPDLNEPDAGNCTVETVVEEPRTVSKLSDYQDERQLKSIAFSVDCSKTKDSDQLLFQLSISRNSLSADSKQNQVDQLNERRLLFAQGDGGAVSGQERSYFSINDILNWEQTIEGINVTSSDDEVTQNDQGFSLLAKSSDENVESLPGAAVAPLPSPLAAAEAASNVTKQTSRFAFRGRGSKTEALSRLITLDEQVDLLKQLVFTIRASNLLKMSAPHAIYGSELKLVELDKLKDQASSKLISQYNHPITATATQQVSRSTNQQDNIEENPPLTLHSTILNNSMRQGNRHGTQATSSLPSSTGNNWLHDYEISITIAAIFATFILSLLTLTLIILVLKGRKKVQNGTVQCVIDTMDTSNDIGNNNNNNNNNDITNNNNNSCTNTLQLTNRIRAQRPNITASESYDMNHFILLMVLFK